VNVEIEEEEKKRKKIPCVNPRDRLANAPYRDEGEAKIV